MDYEKITRYAIDNKINIKFLSPRIIFTALMDNNISLVLELLDYGFDVDAKNDVEDTILTVCSKLGNEMLLDKIIEKDPIDFDEPFRGAVEYSKENIVKKLLVTEFISPELILELFPAIVKSFDFETIKIAVSYITHYSSLLLNVCELNDIRLLDVVRISKSALLERDPDGNTAIMIAAKQNSIEICKKLIECGASLEHRNKNGFTCVTYAIINNNIDMIEFFVDNGLNITGETGIYYLSHAIKYRHIGAITYFLNLGVPTGMEN